MRYIGSKTRKVVNDLKLKKSIQRQRRVICNKCEKVFRISKIYENKYEVDNKPYRYLYFECPFCKTKYDIYNGPDTTKGEIQKWQKQTNLKS